MKNGAMLMNLTVADSREVVGWVLSFGSGVRVVKPHSLSDAVSSEAKKILHS
jgi:predicted DNA-binding transcriptional regulator YafY